MTRKSSINDEYFEWIYSLVYDKKFRKLSYRKLLRCLDDIDFFYILPMDGNRESDGINLRYRFGYDCYVNEQIIASEIDIRPCSVLEMMVALAFRCEENIMDDPDIGNRMGQWFWNMIVSLGLGHMNDNNFDRAYVEDVIDIFLNREYEENGKGGLFTVQDYPRDLRSVEIWCQMCWYLNENI